MNVPTQYENTRMLVSPEYFNEENISKEQYYNWWFKEFSHEVGHIKQIKRDGSEGLYLLKTLWGYVSTQSHDKAPREQEAEKGSEVVIHSGMGGQVYIKEYFWADSKGKLRRTRNPK